MTPLAPHPTPRAGGSRAPAHPNAGAAGESLLWRAAPWVNPSLCDSGRGVYFTGATRPAPVTTPSPSLQSA